jgi:S-adenosylmethionine/arginine decarboxylase-like enzyme
MEQHPEHVSVQAVSGKEPVIVNEKPSWGYHLVLDVAGCNPEAIRDPHQIAGFASRLVTAIDMVSYGEPIVKHFGTGDKAGYTLVQLIETSNICAHFVEENDSACIDVFSCKNFDDNVVVDLVTACFGGTVVNRYLLARGV